jgi:hypothetical protein
MTMNRQENPAGFLLDAPQPDLEKRRGEKFLVAESSAKQ